MFITFEGGDGGGKTTQIRLLRDRLEQAGRAVVLTREPGGTPEAEKIRRLILERDGGDWSPQAETLLMFAARQMHVRDLIAPALAAGRTVLCDRFTDSTRAYQGYAGGMDLAAIETLKKLAIGDLEPSRTIILDLPPEIGLARSRSGAAEGMQEAKGLEFQTRLREGYLAIARANPERCIVIDATGSVDDVAAAIWKALT
ncbi:MAG: dTMP kinase [Rhodospirillales bacterium]|nr:dTMP kinase [Alphaproteobacteria bacterium]MCB9987611.1 dTMP kinase [Rhodospirillales bacterium]USO07674.1 MAG: dTMP kinase [Rhodospirillales bacterium]